MEPAVTELGYVLLKLLLFTLTCEKAQSGASDLGVVVLLIVLVAPGTQRSLMFCVWCVSLRPAVGLGLYILHDLLV